MANLIFNYGTMDSGKSLHLLATVFNFEQKGIGFLLLKPAVDTREGKSVIHSRIGIERECLLAQHDDDLFQLVSERQACQTKPRLAFVVVDECQFLRARQVDQLARVADHLNITVICYGLRTDFRTQLFEGSRRLFEIADRFEELKSRCTCGAKTSVNARLAPDGSVITDGAQVLIGGNETYTPLCRKCWLDKQPQPSSQIAQNGED